MKTQNEILTIVYHSATTLLGGNISGEVYKRTRPTESQLEDCVVNTIAGVRGKLVQDGTLIVKLFYLDINENNTYSEDNARGEIMEQYMIDLSEVLINTTPGIVFYPDSRETYTEPVLDESVHQHYAVLRINFNIL